MRIAARLRRCARAVRWLAIASIGATAASNLGAQVLVVLSGDSVAYRPNPFYANVADEIEAQLGGLRDRRLAIEIVPRERLIVGGAAVLAGREIVITVGYEACASVLQLDESIGSPAPTLCVAIPRYSFGNLAGKRTEGADRRISAVYIGQPFARQLDLLQRALPDRTQVGVVLPADSRDVARELREAAAGRPLALHIATVDSVTEMYGAMHRVLAESNVFLAVPAVNTITDATAYGVLRTSYSAGVPVFGFSESMVRAGALLGLFTTARQYGAQGGEIARRILAKEGGLPPPDWPRYYTVAVNQSVARSLGLHVDSETDLAAAMALPSADPARAKGPR